MSDFSGIHRPLALLAVLAVLAGLPGCDTAGERPTAAEPVEVFRCQELLIGLEAAVCTEDVQGPGTLRVTVKPDPLRSSWELAVSGLVALAENCEFHGSFDQTRLAALQGRGEVELVCPVVAGVDRAYHTLRFGNRLDAPGSSLTITVTFSR